MSHRSRSEVARNASLELHPGSSLEHPQWASGHVIAAGLLAFVLGLPSSSQAQQGDGSILCGDPYVIVGGDSLSAVAKRAYGDPARFDILVDANSDVIGSDPGKIEVGMSIKVPCLDTATRQPMTEAAAAETNAAIQAAVVAEGPLDAAELDALFGPVALFPDPLLTQLLMAVTYPLDVVKAGRFVADSADLSDKDRALAAEKQPWDPSVQQLAAGFPDVVTRMSDHIDWTEQAGEAVLAQTEDVLDSVQRLRTQAQENGYLTNNDQQTVELVDDNIVIAPAEPGVVYVPTYDSQVIYTTPISGPPYYYYDYDDDWEDALLAGAIIVGGAIILDEIFDNNDGWGDWWDDGGSIDWDTGDINIDRGDINIDRGDINIGGDKVNIGDGGRLGDGERVGTLPAREGARDGKVANDLSYRNLSPDAASRDVAKQKIETRKSSGSSAATLPATRPAKSTRPTTNTRPTTATQPAATKRTNVSKPTAARTPSATKSRSSSSAFNKSGGSRSSAAASRGRASSGARRR